jgi:hypothetical protein
MFAGEILAAERPDCAISLPTERFLIDVPSDVAALAKLADVAEEKLRSGRTSTSHLQYWAGCPQAEVFAHLPWWPTSGDGDWNGATKRRLGVPSRAVIEKVEPREPGDPRARGRIDEPMAGDLVDLSAMPVVGWALGRDAPVTRVELQIDGQIVWKSAVGTRRADLEAAFPGQEWARDAGFRGEADLADAVREAKAFEVEALAVLLSGSRAKIGTISGRIPP